MSKRPKDNTVGPWAAEKLGILEQGLNYWTTRLKYKTQWQRVYVDAFAGAGLSEVRRRPKDDAPVSPQMDDLFAGMASQGASDPVEEEVRYLKGSPRVAL